MFEKIGKKFSFEAVSTRTLFLFIIFVTLVKAFFLDRTPLFGDEALYCYLGFNFTKQPFLHALSLTVNHWKDAPGLILLNAINLTVFGQSLSIHVCRITGVFSSGIAAVALLSILRLLTKSKKIHVLSISFLLLNPFSFFFDRTSLMDVPLVALVLIFFYFSLRYLKSDGKKNLFFALLAFMYMFLTKFNSLIIMPFIVGINLLQEKAYPFRKSYYFYVGFLGVLLVALTYLFTNTWDTVFYHVDTTTNIQAIILRFVQNIRLMTSWYVQFLTPLVVLPASIGFIYLLKKKMFAFAFAVPFFMAAYAIVSLNIFPRYLLFTLPFLAIVVGFASLSRAGLIATVVLLVFFAARDYSILAQPQKAHIARETYYQYFSDWSSGIGTRKAIEFFSRQTEAPRMILIPTDLEGLFAITKLAYAPNLATQFIFFADVSALENMLNESQERAYIVATPNHEWISQTVTDTATSTIVHTTNDFMRNSILIYEIHPK